MPLPFLITCQLPAPRLFELADGRFQRIDKTPVSPFMAGYGYLLVEKALAVFLEGLDIERVRFEPAVLWDRGSGEILHTHARLHVGQFFTIDQINDLPLDGLRLLTLGDENYFASSELKSCLEASPFCYLQFSEGLSEFGGIRAEIN